MTHPNESEARELLANHSFQLKRGRDPAVSAVAAALSSRDAEKRRADEAEAELARVREVNVALKSALAAAIQNLPKPLLESVRSLAAEISSLPTTER